VAVPSSPGSGWGRSGHRRALVAGGLVLVIVLGGGAAAWAASNGGNSGYRTASVTRTNIGQSMTVVGTVEPVNDASASFQVAGKVATVSATVGQQVTAGESLGTLDTTALSESVSSAQSTLNADEAKLAEDESRQASTTAQNVSDAPSTTATTAPATHGDSTSGQSIITHDQNTLTKDEAQTAVDQHQEAADLAQAQKTCATSGTATTSSATTTTTDPTGCEAALALVSNDQQRVSTDQATVAKDEAALSQALNQSSPSGSAGLGGSGSAGGTANSGSSTEDSGAVSSTPSSAASDSGTETRSGAGATGSSTSSDTPQQIASDQADIDTAQAQLTEAEQALVEGDLTSPINGTIVSVGVAAGDTVSADSSTAVIVIIGTGSFEVTSTLSSSQVPSVKVGDSAGVQVDGVDGTIKGTVSQVGPVQSGDSGFTYPVVVALPTTATGLFTGSTANVVISTGGVAHVVAVPTSAVQSLGTRSYVETLSNGALARKIIKVGMVGDTYTQVLSGLTPGESVVLANYAAPVPSSNTATLGGFGGLGGGGGGGFGGGGAFRQRVLGGAGGAAGTGGAAGGFGNAGIGG
jgi:multidrug efflux pump subunit AcrA (membrane-fusion protein)